MDRIIKREIFMLCDVPRLSWSQGTARCSACAISHKGSAAAAAAGLEAAAGVAPTAALQHALQLLAGRVLPAAPSRHPSAAGCW